MPFDSARCTLTVSALALPGVAYGQNIPPIIAALAISPLFALLLAVALGVISRSWLLGAVHAGLIAVWVLLFGIASYWVENDYVIWTPLALYGLHAVIMVVLIFKGMTQRNRR